MRIQTTPTQSRPESPVAGYISPIKPKDEYETLLSHWANDSLESFHSAQQGMPSVADVQPIGPVQALAHVARQIWALLTGQNW